MNKYKFFLKNLFSIVFILILIFSCNQKKDIDTISTKQNNEFIELDKFEDSILSVGKIASSLRYEKQDGSNYQVNAHLSTNDEILMIEEKITNPKSFLFQANLFFFKNGEIIASKQLIQKSIDSLSSPTFSEVLTFYKDKKAVKSFNKIGKNEEELKKLSYTKIENNMISYDKAKRALNQQGEFITTFQGFVFNNNSVYIVVGEPGDNTYSSALKVNNKDDLVLFLLKDQKKYLNRKLKIIFEIIEEQNGFSYQSYIQGTFSD